MAIDVKLDLVMVKKKMSLTELSARIGISMTNLSLLKTGKVKGVRFSTLEAICRELECQPGDILEYVPAAADRRADESIPEAKEGSDE
jgi:putative transcriptional regulator